MRRFSSRHPLTTLSELNVTPLLDLAFVLLVIFMITTPLMENSVDIVLPSSTAAKNAVDPKSVQTLSISRSEALRLNGDEISLSSLEGRMKAMRAGDPNLAVVIRSHSELPVQKLVDVMDVLQRNQITRIGVVTNPEE